MRDYKHLTRFPAEDKALLEAAREITGLTINELIVRATHERLPQMVAESKGQNLTPLPESAVASAYESMSESELAEDRELGRASIKAHKGQP
jgi:DNA mismatch repair protein MutH